MNVNSSNGSNGVHTQNGARARSSTSAQSTERGVVDTEFLIVGAGPAGAALACFLASYGLKGIMVSSASGTANTPRAHITNMAALECLRDIGLDKEMESVASKGHCMTHTRWCHSMAGEEFARIHSWGNAPDRKGDYERASPCAPVDLPQTLLEPLLVRHAINTGFKARFNTSFLHFDEDATTGMITATMHDRLTNLEYKIRTKYLFGADGARSKIVKQLDLPLTAKPGGGMAINVLVKADLTHLVEHRQGNLHWVMQPDREHPDFGWMGLVRMVKPWHEWMFIIFPSPAFDAQSEPSNEQYHKRIREFIGDDTPAEILNVSKWFINEIVADEYSRGNIFCLGDAVHRHPPFNGLGSNTCIQDAFNLAWKIAYVSRGLASPSLLTTFFTERQPVGHSVVLRANNGFRDHSRIWEALGTLPEDIATRRSILDELRAANSAGVKRRKMFRDAILSTAHEFHGLGIEMNQRYEGVGVYVKDEPAPYARTGKAAEDEILYHEPSTYPGCRLPHAWLNTAIPSTPRSTIDLAGHGAFTLLTGIGGDAWKAAAKSVSGELGVPINVYSVGFRQDWEDVYYDWERVRGVEESGAVLVRPDRFVAWRAERVVGDEEHCGGALGQVMRAVLGVE